MVEDEQLEGRLSTREEAVDLVRERFGARLEDGRAPGSPDGDQGGMG